MREAWKLRKIREVFEYEYTLLSGTLKRKDERSSFVCIQYEMRSCWNKYSIIHLLILEQNNITILRVDRHLKPPHCLKDDELAIQMWKRKIRTKILASKQEIIIMINDVKAGLSSWSNQRVSISYHTYSVHLAYQL